MAESYLTTDIIVIIVLTVLVGLYSIIWTQKSRFHCWIFLPCSSHRYLRVSCAFLLDENRHCRNLEYRQMEFYAQFDLSEGAQLQPTINGEIARSRIISSSFYIFRWYRSSFPPEEKVKSNDNGLSHTNVCYTYKCESANQSSVGDAVQRISASKLSWKKAWPCDW